MKSTTNVTFVADERSSLAFSLGSTRNGEMNPLFQTFLATVITCIMTTAVLGRPNIVLVMADDQGWGDMAYNGHPVLKTIALRVSAPLHGIQFRDTLPARFNTTPVDVTFAAYAP